MNSIGLSIAIIKPFINNGLMVLCREKLANRSPPSLPPLLIARDDRAPRCEITAVCLWSSSTITPHMRGYLTDRLTNTDEKHPITAIGNAPYIQAIHDLMQTPALYNRLGDQMLVCRLYNRWTRYHECTPFDPVERKTIFDLVKLYLGVARADALRNGSVTAQDAQQATNAGKDDSSQQGVGKSGLKS
jgi:hypothetical protein